MNRRNLFLALFGLGAAKAQNKSQSQSDTDALVRAYHGCIGPQWSSTCKKVNGQCPVCGTMAEKYIRKPIWTPCSPNEMSTTNGNKMSMEPAERHTRCATCNTIFGQDAE